jgi:phosphotransferase system enzyme I (PtsI)
VSEELLPSEIAELDLDYARAVATDAGGWTSHMAILARGLGIPAVVGLRDFYRRARTGDPVIVDANRSEVILYPSPTTIKQYQAQMISAGRTQVRSAQPVSGPTRTLDGVEVVLRANVELTTEFAAVREYGASGVGLYRSEFLLGRDQTAVSEETQYRAYVDVARISGEDGAIVRLFDLGALIREGTREAERNPALGLRAIRLGLKFDQGMRVQVRAILRAAAEGKLSILLPMVADVEDVRRAKQIIQEERQKLESAGFRIPEVPVGAMIEVPSAVITAEKIARTVDFFELGTNDLVQYTLAVDRGNEEVADWFRTLHPAVLFGIHRSLEAARKIGIPAIVCGEMASTPVYATLLIGMGAVEVSMTPAALPRIRWILSQIDAGEAGRVAQSSLDCETADQVERLVSREFGRLWPNVFPPDSLPVPDAN